MGVLKSAIGIGGLLCQGIGDTIRVSLTADPVEEVRAALDILSAAGLRKTGPDLISCPTCGRTRYDMIPIAREVERRLEGCTKPITVAVMGCVVNGPGEARRRRGHRRRRRRGPAVPPWRNSAQGSPGQAGGRPDGRDRQAVREGPVCAIKIPFFTFFRELCAAPGPGPAAPRRLCGGRQHGPGGAHHGAGAHRLRPLPEAAVTALRQLLMDQYQLRQLLRSTSTPGPQRTSPTSSWARRSRESPSPSTA